MSDKRLNTKVTAKDVAREAGVSEATVSYVLNGREDQKISPQTRKKILQIANLMNYVPSHAAKSLATGHSNTIGISYHMTASPTRDARIMQFVNMLIARLNRMKYDVSFVPPRKEDETLFIRNIDAIIAVDLNHDDFRTLADNYLVPVICVDMCVNDELFFQIYEDMPSLCEKALLELGGVKEAVFLYDEFENSDYEQFILGLNSGIFPLRSRELGPAFSEKLKSSKVIIHGTYLALRVLSTLDPADVCVIAPESERPLLPHGIHFIADNSDKKANLTMNIVMNALKRNFDIPHDQKVR